MNPSLSRSAPATRWSPATVNAGGRLLVQATRIGADTQLAQMARLVEGAQNGKAQVQRPGGKVSGTFVPVVILLSLVSVLQRPIKCLRRFSPFERTSAAAVSPDNMLGTFRIFDSAEKDGGPSHDFIPSWSRLIPSQLVCRKPILKRNCPLSSMS